MNKVMVIPHQEHHLPAEVQKNFTDKQIEILKNSICKGISREEFEIFLMACTKTQLDPFMRQIYAVKRKSRKPDGSWGEAMTIQTGIDGYRLIAERTERYAPGPEPTYVYDDQNKLVSATAYIKKQTKDGTWHTVSASAYMDEYCQRKLDGTPSGMWATMQRTMLSKCAESQALRKAFPSEMSGVYTKEEMGQADKISVDQAAELELILDECNPKYKSWVLSYLVKSANIAHLFDLPADMFDRVRVAAIKNMQEYQEQKKLISQEKIED